MWKSKLKNKEIRCLADVIEKEGSEESYLYTKRDKNGKLKGVIITKIHCNHRVRRNNILFQRLVITGDIEIEEYKAEFFYLYEESWNTCSLTPNLLYVYKYETFKHSNYKNEKKMLSDLKNEKFKKVNMKRFNKKVDYTKTAFVYH